MILFQSLEEFSLMENMGNLAKYKFPEEIIRNVYRKFGSRGAGTRSEIKEIKEDLSLKKFKLLLIVLFNNEPNLLIERESERKYNLYDLKEQHRTYKKSGRRGRGYYSNGFELGNYSSNTLYDKIQGVRYQTRDENGTLEKTDDDVSIEYHLIYKDTKTENILKKRQDSKNLPKDKLDTSKDWSNDVIASRSQELKNNIIYGKTLKKIEKSVAAYEKSIFDKIKNNFEKAFEKLIDDLKSGYSWNVTPTELGKNLTSSIKLDELTDLKEIYTLVKDISKAKNIKDLQITKRKLDKLIAK